MSLSSRFFKRSSFATVQRVLSTVSPQSLKISTTPRKNMAEKSSQQLEDFKAGKKASEKRLLEGMSVGGQNEGKPLKRLRPDLDDEDGENGMTVDQLTTGFGCPLDTKTAVLTAGERGPMLIQDIMYLDEMTHFDRERIPERVVHAKGAGAFGYFEVTHDISQYCKAEVFDTIGKKTPVAVRFSTVGGEAGSADTARDPRGFSVKMYTEQGNWDCVGNNTPIFFIRDPIHFPNFIHTQKRSPKTHLKDPNMFWDFITLRPETAHQVSFLFSDRGTPDGYRKMNGYGSHTFKLVNKDGNPVYCKFHYKTDQGVSNLLPEEAEKLAGSNPDYAIQDLYNAIESGNCPSWTWSIQVMTLEQAEKCPFNPFDVTKVWSHKDYPLIPVGKMVLDRNPENYFAEVEQMAYSPANMVPGIEASPDKMLQGRLFSYHDTHIHRLGLNYNQIPVNCPYRTRGGVKNYQRDGPMCMDGNQGGAPNYYPNSFSGPEPNMKYAAAKCYLNGCDVKRHETRDDDNFTQAGVFYREVLNSEERTRLVNNIAGHVCNAKKFIQQRCVENFSKCDKEYGTRIAARLQELEKK